MAVLDRSALEQLCELIGGDRDSLYELVETFIEEGAEIVADLRASLPDCQVDVLRRGAHSMKSSAQDFGAGELAAQSATLEARAATGWPDTAEPDVAALSQAFDAAGAELQSWLNAQRPERATTSGT